MTWPAIWVAATRWTFNPVGFLVASVFLFPAHGAGVDPRSPGPSSDAKPTPKSEQVAAELGLGRWIWTTNFTDKQECRLWHAFTLPATNAVRKANLRITADNSYRLYLDGREIGQGADWKYITDYDVTWLMTSGTRVLGVEILNDGLAGGLMLGLSLEFADGQREQILSDRSWKLVPNNARRWLRRTHPDPAWPAAKEVGVVGQNPWWLKPWGVLAPPPLRPIEFHFWQSGWFLGGILTLCAVALALSVRLGTKLAVQNRAQKLMVRERARIARDIHDDLGSALTQLVLQSEVALTEFPEGSTARGHLGHLAERARGAAQALDEVVWAVNSKRDTLRDFTSYLCKYAQGFLEGTSIRCRLDVQPELPAMSFELPVRRGLFLAVKEALNNAAKHSQATELTLGLHLAQDRVQVSVADNGLGFDTNLLGGDRNGLANMQQRLAELGGECRIGSAPGAGCRVEFLMPLKEARNNGHSFWHRLAPRKDWNANPAPVEAGHLER